MDPSVKWENFSEEEQNKVVKAKRSNNELDVSKLSRQYPQVKPAREALITRNMGHTHRARCCFTGTGA